MKHCKIMHGTELLDRAALKEVLGKITKGSCTKHLKGQGKIN